MGVNSRKRTRRRAPGLATATAYLATVRSAHAFVPQTSSTTTAKNTHVATSFGGGGSGSQNRLYSNTDEKAAALRMVASRPRIGEDIFVGNADIQPARRPRRTRSSANSSSSNNRRRQQAKRNNSDGRQQKNKNRNYLPVLDEDHVSFALHEEIAPILRRFDDMSSQHASSGSAESSSALAKAMTVLSQAVNVIDSHMNTANANGATNILAGSENNDQAIHTEWLVHYASKVVRSYLQIERTLDLDLPDHPNLGGDANDPLYQANALLQRLERYCSEGLPWIDTAGSVLSASYLRERIYNHVIGAYTKRAKVVGMTSEDTAREFVQIAESIVERMAAGANKTDQNGLVGPDAKSYGMVLSAYARCVGGAEAAANLLERMETRCASNAVVSDQKAHPRPNVVCYNTVMNACARSGRPNDAVELLERMETHGIEADVVSYTSILDGYARWLESSALSKKSVSVTESDVLDAIANTEEIMISLERSKDGPNVVAYNALLKVYLNGAKLLGQIQCDAESSSSQLLDLAASASSTFDRMAKAKIHPNFVTYSCAVHVGAAAADSIALRPHKSRSHSWKSQALDAATLSFDILANMEHAYVDNNDARLCPPVKLYNMVITALGRCNSEAGIAAAHDLIQHMEDNDDLDVISRPNTVTYTAYMKALADMCCPSAARRAEEVLTTMETLYRKGNTAVKPTLMSYNTSLRAWAKVQNRNGAERADRVLSQMEAKHNAGISPVCPDLYSYSICIDAWAKSRDGCAGERAENIFERMQSEPACLQPNLVVYNALINAWGASRDVKAGDKAMAVLTEMEEKSNVQPDRFSYSSVIDALAKSGTENAAELAEGVLARMETNGGRRIPSIVTYNCVLNVLASSKSNDSGARAEAILGRMDVADAVSYNTVVKAWANSGCGDKAMKARRILNKMMEEADVPMPDIYTFNSVLNACASSTADHVRAFEIAMETFQLMKQFKHVRPNAFTYGTLLKACATLLPVGEERTTLTAQIYSECERNGCLSDPVLRMLQSSLSEDEFVHMVGLE